MLLGVEELGRQQVGVQVLVLDLERRDPRGADRRVTKSLTVPPKFPMPMYCTSNATVRSGTICPGGELGSA